MNLQKQQTKQSLEQGRTDPETLANRAINEKLNPFAKEDIRYVPTLDEEIGRLDALTAARVRKLYSEQLSGQTGEFVAVGEFDPAKRLALLTKLNETMNEEAALIFVAHDLNPRGLSPKVQGFVQAQSWFQDLTPVSVGP